MNINRFLCALLFVSCVVSCKWASTESKAKGSNISNPAPIVSASPSPPPDATISPSPSPTGGSAQCNRGTSREVWAIHGQSNAQGENTMQISSLPATVAMAYRPKQADVVSYQEPIGLFDDGLAASKTHNLIYKFAQDYNANTQHVVVAVPVFRGATSLSRKAALAPNPSFLDSPVAPFNLMDVVLNYIQGASKASASTDSYVLYAGGEYDAFKLQSTNANDNLTKDEYKRDLRIMINRLVNGAGVKKIFAAGVIRMFKPDAFDLGPSKHSVGEDLVYESQKEVAAEMPTRFAVVFDARTIPFDAPYRNSDSIHLSAFGQDFLGQALADGVLKNLGCK